ncbi:hypothetical protein GNAINCEL_00126 [Serratia phage KKP 3709]|nr:hypothetical protein GNAINCEL_00126 [Serratia phage KKP 3709]
MYVLILIVTLTSAFGDGGQALQTGERVGFFQTKKSCDDAGVAVSSVQQREMEGSDRKAILVTSHKCVFVEAIQ